MAKTPISFPKGDLGEYEGRLRRAMALDGLIPLSFEGGPVLPVVVIDQLTGPGMGQARGRRFSAQLPAGANLSFFSASVDVVVDEIQWWGAGAGAVDLMMFPSNATLVGGVGTNVLFLDRPVSLSDRPSVVCGDVIDPGAGARLIVATAQVTVNGVVKFPGFTVAAGGGFAVRKVAAGGQGMAYGWVF